MSLRGGGSERVRKLSGVSSYKGANPILRAPPSGRHLNLITPPKAPSPNTIILGAKASTYESEGMGPQFSPQPGHNFLGTACSH